MKNFTLLITFMAILGLTRTYDQPVLQRIVIPKPNPPQQCQHIQGVGNPINLLKVLIDVLNKNLGSQSNAQVTLIFQNQYNQLSTFVFKIYTYQSVDYIAVVYKDGYQQGAVLHQIMTEDLSMINRALNLNVYDNGQTIYCPDIICSWSGTCKQPVNCQNCPNCPGCQTPPIVPQPQVPPYCNQCPNCQGCPGVNGYNNNNNQGGFTFGGAFNGQQGLFVLGESAPEGMDDEESS